MKYYLLTILLLPMFVNAECTSEIEVKSVPVEYTVNTSIPEHLKGATITVTLADGSSSIVPAEKFMVVPRKQKTIIGDSHLISNTTTCKFNSKKNTIMLEAKNSKTDIETKTTPIPSGSKVDVYSKKELVPGLSLYRRELFDSPVGGGLGVDTKGELKGMIGLDF